MTHWYYLTFENGRLYDEEGYLFVNCEFASASEADQYLIDQDLRASIR